MDRLSSADRISQGSLTPLRLLEKVLLRDDCIMFSILQHRINSMNVNSYDKYRQEAMSAQYPAMVPCIIIPLHLQPLASRSATLQTSL